MRPGDERAGLAPPRDESSLGELRQDLAHRHPRATVLGRQLMLERNAIAGRPLAGKDACFDVRENALMERKRRPLRAGGDAHIGDPTRGRLLHHAARKLRIALRNRVSIASRRLCRPFSTSFSPPTQTRSTRPLSTNIHASSAPSGLSPSTSAWSRRSETKSAGAPGSSRAGAASAAPPPRKAASNSALPVDALASPITLRSRKARRWAYSSRRNSSA